MGEKFICHTNDHKPAATKDPHILDSLSPHLIPFSLYPLSHLSLLLIIHSHTLSHRLSLSRHFSCLDPPFPPVPSVAFMATPLTSPLSRPLPAHQPLVTWGCPLCRCWKLLGPHLPLSLAQLCRICELYRLSIILCDCCLASLSL
jgi:hypothetical protein